MSSCPCLQKSPFSLVVAEVVEGVRNTACDPIVEVEVGEVVRVLAWVVYQDDQRLEFQGQSPLFTCC